MTDQAVTTHVRVPVHAAEGTPCKYVTSRCGRMDAGPHPDQPLVGLLERARNELAQLLGLGARARSMDQAAAEGDALLSEIDEALRGDGPVGGAGCICATPAQEKVKGGDATAERGHGDDRPNPATAATPPSAAGAGEFIATPGDGVCESECCHGWVFTHRLSIAASAQEEKHRRCEACGSCETCHPGECGHAAPAQEDHVADCAMRLTNDRQPCDCGEPERAGKAASEKAAQEVRAAQEDQGKGPEPGLLFSDLRAANILRLPQFKNRRGEPAHSQPDGSDWKISEWTNAMAGEAGEACNVAKKIVRGDYDSEAEGREALAKELADAVIYADIAAFRIGVSLGQAVQDKFCDVLDACDPACRTSGSGSPPAETLIEHPFRHRCIQHPDDEACNRGLCTFFDGKNWCVQPESRHRTLPTGGR